MTSTIGSRSWPIRSSAGRLTTAPMTTPMVPWATRKSPEGSASGVGEVSACAIPPTSEAKSTADGRCTSDSTTLSTTVTPTTRASAARGERSDPVIADD